MTQARTFLETVLCHRERREGIPSTDLEGEMRDDLRGLRLRQAVIHCPVEVVGNLRDLAGSNQGADRDQTAIPRRKVRTQPQVPERNISAQKDSAELSRCGRLRSCHADL
jgi:hypothetical protein